jgi:predicted HTH domain antitoxin
VNVSYRSPNSRGQQDFAIKAEEKKESRGRIIVGAEGIIPFRKEPVMDTKMITLETQVPEDIFLTLQASGHFKEALMEKSRQLLAMRLYQERSLSFGKAARMAGVNYWEFINLLSDNNIPVIDYSPEELAAEFEAVERLKKELGK